MDSEICRICLKNGPTSNKTPIDAEIQSNIKELTGLKLKISSNFPKLVCSKCTSRLKYFLEFKYEIIVNQNYIYENFKDSVNVNIKTEDPEIEKEENKISAVFIKSEPDENLDYVEEGKDVEVSNIQLLEKESKSALKTKPKKQNREDKNQPCEVCGILLKAKSYKSHVELMHLDIRKFKCDICSRGFTRKSKVLTHLKTHFKIKDIPCKECDLMFSSRSTLQNHVKVIHRGIQLYQTRTCEFCGKIFNNRTYYLTHIRLKHTGERPYVCSYKNCDKSYASASDLFKHKKGSHAQPIECPICSRMVKDLKTHTARHFKKKEKNFVCNLIENGQVCGRKFPGNSYLKKHVDVHHRGQTYNCTECESTYCKRFNLELHIRNVHEQRRIKCRFCATLLTRKDYYIKHIRTSHSDMGAAKMKILINEILQISQDDLFNFKK